MFCTGNSTWVDSIQILIVANGWGQRLRRTLSNFCPHPVGAAVPWQGLEKHGKIIPLALPLLISYIIKLTNARGTGTATLHLFQINCYV